MDALRIHGREYRLEVERKVHQPPDAPRLVVVGYQPNETAVRLLKACLRGIQGFTPDPYELWVVDNHSPGGAASWLSAWPGINVIYNCTEPLPPEARQLKQRLLAWRRRRPGQRNWASYANAIGLELAVRVIDAQSRLFLPLHMDTFPCHPGWLDFLRSKIFGPVAAAGVRLDRARVPEGVLHVLGLLLDFQIFQALDLDFFPDLPRLDVGDRVTVRLRQAGYGVFACPNTLSDPGLAKRLPLDSPFRGVPVDRAFDDHGNVIFLHYGRGIQSATGSHARPFSIADWLALTGSLLQD